jgi:protein-S-isoprenylcysteine O-methyltransferase Ste14
MKVETVAIIFYAAWLVSELVILRRANDRSGMDVDRRSMVLLASSNFLAPLISIILYFLGVGAAAWPWWLKVTGVVLMACGYLIRWSGMWTLRAYFSANVAVQCDQQLVMRGPYRLVRHPGYFGGWLSFVGLGLALGNWVALILLGILTVPAFLYRIGVEEGILRQAFPAYADYATGVKKFVPFVW